MDKISLRVTDGKNIVTALLKNAIVAKIDIQEAFTKSSIREECLITIDKKDFTNAVEKITKVFEPKKRFKIHVHRLSGFGDISTEKMLVAIRLLECVINSSKFKLLIESYSFKNAKIKGKRVSSKKVFEMIMSGKDQFNVEDDNDMDLFITLCNRWYSSTVGYTYPDTYKTWINYKFFKKFDIAEIAGNLIHEYMHNIGFTHDLNWNKTRKNSVPYAIGDIVQMLANMILIERDEKN